ncbi:YbhB/YbcL family Raf kinase inhibitor-like protein [Streptomyces sp. YIM S03343]
MRGIRGMRGRGSVTAMVALMIAPALMAGCADSGDGGGANGGDSSASSAAPSPTAARRITVSSSAFAEDGTVPRRHTCDGADVSPPLAFSGVPEGAAGLTVLVEDPDAPRGTFTHWLLWDADPHETRWAAGTAPRGAVQGRNGFGKNSYGGPCPPRGSAPHHYVFTVYATDRALGLAPGASADTLKRALEGHVLASGTLTGRYGR